MKVDYYNSGKGITEIIPTEQLTIPQTLEIIKSTKFKRRIENYQKTNDDTLKRKLPYFTFSGTFTQRAADKIIKASGVLVLDIDKIDDMSIRKSLTTNKHTYFLFRSPSYKGFKLGVKIPEVQNNVEFKEYWESVAKHYNLPTNIDPQAKDISRACFVSHDPETYYNPESETFTEKTPIENTFQQFDSFDQTTLNTNIIDMLVPEWAPGKRQHLALYLAAVLRQKGYGTVLIRNIISEICQKAKDKDKTRFNVINTTFEKNEIDIKGYSGLKELLPPDTFKELCSALEESIRKPRKEYELQHLSSHIPMYSILDKALGLYGSRYNQLKKLLWYSLLGNAMKGNSQIDYCGTTFDTRESIIVFAPSGSGKNEISRVMMDAIPMVDTSSDITSLHPEQLIGKVIQVTNKTTKQKEKKEIRGYFDEDMIVMDEARDFFLPTSNNAQKQQFNELRKYFCTALNPIGENLITKRLTEHTRENALKYHPKCTCCFLSQPVAISGDSINSGFMRRFTMIEVKGRMNREDIYRQRVMGVSKTPFIDQLCNHFNNLNIPGDWVFEDISEHLIRYSSLLCDYGIDYSEKSSSFIKDIYEQSMYNKMLKYSVLAAVTRGSKKVTVQDIKVAYMDLFEIFSSMFDCLENHAEDFYSGGVSYNELLLLRWLKQMKATSRNKSTVNVKSTVNKLEYLYGVKNRQAVNYFNRFKKQGFIDIFYGKTNAQVVISEKGLDLLNKDSEAVPDGFYEEYLKICKEVKNNQ